MSAITMYHNPRCSKSRETLKLLEEKGVQPTIVLYLEQVPTAPELRTLIAKLGLAPRDLLRKGEDEYKLRGLGNLDLGDDELIAAMVACPKLIERPIVVSGDRAVLGRPPENALALLD